MPHISLVLLSHCFLLKHAADFADLVKRLDDDYSIKVLPRLLLSFSQSLPVFAAQTELGRSFSWIESGLFPHHDVFQFHVQQVSALHILLPVLRVFAVVHVVQNELEENDLLGHGAEGVVEAELVVSFLCLHSEKRPPDTIKDV